MNKKVYAKRGAKTVKGNGSAGEKDRITAIMGTLMDGTKLPLHFVIKGTAHPVNTRIKANLSTRYRNKPNISVQQNAWCDKDVMHDLVKLEAVPERESSRDMRQLWGAPTCHDVRFATGREGHRWKGDHGAADVD